MALRGPSGAAVLPRCSPATLPPSSHTIPTLNTLVRLSSLTANPTGLAMLADGGCAQGQWGFERWLWPLGAARPVVARGIQPPNHRDPYTAPAFAACAPPVIASRHRCPPGCSDFASLPELESSFPRPPDTRERRLRSCVVSPPPRWRWSESIQSSYPLLSTPLGQPKEPCFVGPLRVDWPGWTITG